MARSKGYNGGLLPGYQQIWKTCDPSTVSLEGRVTREDKRKEAGSEDSRSAISSTQTTFAIPYVCMFAGHSPSSGSEEGGWGTIPWSTEAEEAEACGSHPCGSPPCCRRRERKEKGWKQEPGSNAPEPRSGGVSCEWEPKSKRELQHEPVRSEPLGGDRGTGSAEQLGERRQAQKQGLLYADTYNQEWNDFRYWQTEGYPRPNRMPAGRGRDKQYGSSQRRVLRKTRAARA